METTISEQGEKLVVVLSGDFDNMASMKAERDMAPVFDHTGGDVLIDCTNLDYISSSGLRILLSIFKHTRANGHKTVLKGMKDDVKEVFELSGFIPLFIWE